MSAGEQTSGFVDIAAMAAGDGGGDGGDSISVGVGVGVGVDVGDGGDSERPEQPSLPMFGGSGSFSGLLQRSTVENQSLWSRRQRRDKTPHPRLAPILLSPRSFNGFWALLVGLHAAHAAFLISCGRLYWFLEHPYLSYYADLISPADSRYFRSVGTILGVLGGWNALECLVLLDASIRARQPAVPSTGVLQSGSAFLHRQFAAGMRWARPPVVRRNQTVRPFRAESGELPSRRGKLAVLVEQAVDLFSIESERFDTVFTLREAAVVAAQTYQCATFSSRIARPWINHASVALLVANCVSVAVLYRLLRRYDQFIKRASMRISTFSSPSWHASPAFARLLCHVLDCLLTFAMSVVLPLAVFAPYIRQFDAQELSFPDSLVYGDTAFPNMVRENQALFARSLLDVGIKLVPHVSIYFCLLVIAGVLRTRGTPLPASLSPPESATTHSSAVAAHRASSHDQQPAARHRLRRIRLPTRAGIDAWLRGKRVAGLFLSVAAVVLTLHLRAILSNSAGSGFVASVYSEDNSTDARAVSLCAQAIYPWFSSGASCAVVVYNCHRLGVASPPASAFDLLDPSTVSSVIFMHCPLLVVPAAVQSFGNLLGFEVYNSTLVEWGVEAALTNAHHPDLVFLILVGVDMAELPPGMLQTPFPTKLADIELCVTNLSAVPASLPDVWANVGVLYIEHSLFAEVPPEVLAIPALSEFSMVGNQIAALPDDFSDVVATDELYLFALGFNPLASLPPSLRDGLSFAYLSLERTALTKLPAWAGERVDEQLSLYGTPLCELSPPAPSPSTDSDEFLSRSDPVVEAACTTRDESADGYYPLDLTAPMRPL